MTTNSQTNGNGTAKAQALARFIEETFLVSFSDGKLSLDSDLFEAGVLDSFGVVELVSFIEGAFGVTLETEDFLSQQLASVSGLVEIIEERSRA